ncbi:hypothetical protein LSTR_LSTR004444 [Laodelphax striatellus]|uniref:Uncharacterized protein n=1 Tax=Laodelphax striatellus TaxID=195883 RepID=A0A482X981_LAOST|nr:hypothetical protein LSTR_LSTR004444 [Laodelphax striatellus]
MDNDNYEEFQESLIFYRTGFCKKVIRITESINQLEECDLTLSTKPKKSKKVNWKYNPKLTQDQIFEGELESLKEEAEGSSSDYKNLLKVEEMMKKMKLLKEVSEVDETVKGIPDEVILEKLKRFGV